jgi:DNA-binding MarR family transcriptional regulator
MPEGPKPDPILADTGTPVGPAGDPPQRRISLPFDIFMVSQRLGTYLDRALEETGVRPAEYAVYSLMLEAGPRTPSELAAMLGMPLSTLSTYITAMLGRGDARRIPNPTDGRSVRVVLTDRGRGVVRRVNPPFTQALVALEANLDRPVAEVRAVVLEIIDAIERADADRPTETAPRPTRPRPDPPVAPDPGPEPKADTSSS